MNWSGIMFKSENVYSEHRHSENARSEKTRAQVVSLAIFKDSNPAPTQVFNPFWDSDIDHSKLCLANLHIKCNTQ